MRVGEAKAAAARWVAGHAAGRPGFAGAFVTGSAAWLPDTAELPATSDVDLTVVTAGPAPPKLGKLRSGGVLVEVGYLPAAELGTPERLLGNYYLAGSFRGPGTILADPDGRMAALRAAVAAEFPRRRWVLARCAHAERRILDGLGGLDPAAPLPAQVLAWLFPTGVTTHVLLCAGLRNPTVRLRYLAARELLDDHGQAAVHQELLGLLGCAGLGRARVERHLAAMTAAFDAAAALPPARFPFAADLTATARPVAVDGSRQLVAGGHHHEAVFWVAATYARCLTALAAHDRAAAARHQPGFAELLADLEVGSPAALARRARAVRGYLPRLRQVRDAIVAANPEVRD